jgi:hypothetical protein
MSMTLLWQIAVRLEKSCLNQSIAVSIFSPHVLQLACGNIHRTAC